MDEGHAHGGRDPLAGVQAAVQEDDGPLRGPVAADGNQRQLATFVALAQRRHAHQVARVGQPLQLIHQLIRNPHTQSTSVLVFAITPPDFAPILPSDEIISKYY